MLKRILTLFLCLAMVQEPVTADARFSFHLSGFSMSTDRERETAFSSQAFAPSLELATHVHVKSAIAATNPRPHVLPLMEREYPTIAAIFDIVQALHEKEEVIHPLLNDWVTDHSGLTSGHPDLGVHSLNVPSVKYDSSHHALAEAA